MIEGGIRGVLFEVDAEGGACGTCAGETVDDAGGVGELEADALVSCMK